MGRVLGGIKKRRRQLAPAIPRFEIKRTFFSQKKERRRQLAPATPRIYQFGSSLSVEIKETSRFPTPAKRVEK